MINDHKTCMITGAAMGLGFEFSKLAAADHYNLLLLDKNGGKLEKARQFLQETYPVSVTVFEVDLSVPGITKWLDSLLHDHEIDILINNAGFGLYGKFADTNWEYEEQMITLQIKNLTLLTKKVIKKMLRRKNGKILNVSSVAAFLPGPFNSVYSASKAYIKSFSMAIADEVRGTGVSVSVFCPGKLNTNFAADMALISHSSVSKITLSVVNLEKAAKAAYRGMQKGKVIIVPGIFNKLIVLLSHLLPAKTTAYLNGRIQQEIRRG